MNLRTYATRFLLIMTAILGFAVAQGAMYAGTLCECLTEFIEAKTCFDDNTGAVTLVTLTRFGQNQFQCEIRSGAARIALVSDIFGLISRPNPNLICQIQTSGVPAGGCNGVATTFNLTEKDQAAWRSLVRAECRAAQ